MSEEELRALVRAVREHPEAAAELRRVLLTEELLALPQTVALQGETLVRLTDRVDALAEQMTALAEHAERVEAQISALEAQISALIDTVAQLAGDLRQLTRDQGEMRQMLGRLIEVATGAFERIENRLARLEAR